MRLNKLGPKALVLAIAMFGLAACETTPEQSAAASGTGAATQRQIVPGSQEDLVVNVGDRVFFDYDKFDLKPQARATLDRQAAWMKRYPNVRLSVEGHADERGTREYNLALGERRANSVRNYLTSQGIAANRLSVISYGKERPAALGANEAAWAQNRRGVSVVQ